MNELLPLFGQSTGWIILFMYAAFAWVTTNHYAKNYADNKTSFLLARRELNTFQGSLSIAAAWLWAPGLFISAQIAYQKGLVGLFWFCFGNFLTLMLFGLVIPKLRERLPDGFTFSGYLKEKFSGRVQNLFLAEMIVLATCAFAINLVAGSKTVEVLTGIPYMLTTVAMVCVSLLYSFRNGLKATVVTEVIKILVVWTGIIILVPWTIINAGGWDVVTAGMGGITGQGGDIFGSPFAWGVFTSFGITAFLGHLGGPWGDNSFYQRAFSIHTNSIRRSFIISAFVFGIIPVLMGLLGFVAAGSGIEIPNALVGTTNAITIATFLPAWAILYFIFLVFSGLVSILDSQFASIANMAGHDIASKFNMDSVTFARSGMVALAIAGLIIANIPGIQLLHIFLFFALLRALVWLPSMFLLINEKLVNENGMFWGILIAGIISIPMFTYGKLNGISDFTFYGTLIAVFGSAALSLGITKISAKA
jgi:Na+/proline symporter